MTGAFRFRVPWIDGNKPKDMTPLVNIDIHDFNTHDTLKITLRSYSYSVNIP